jgi:hypothetical protein
MNQVYDDPAKRISVPLPENLFRRAKAESILTGYPIGRIVAKWARDGAEAEFLAERGVSYACELLSNIYKKER